MPEKDVVIYGEWKVQEGTFEPTITKELISSKDYYRVGDVVSFKITVTNTASFPIKEVIVKENKENAIFIEGSNYTVSSDHIATIDQISALDSVELYANYIVTSDEYGTVQNEVEIKGALSDINYELKDKEYKATASFKIQSELTICKKVSGTDTSNTFGFLVTGTNKYETWVILGKDECKTIYVSPSTYKIKEMVPQEYKIEKVEGSITSDNASFVVEFDKKYEITYTNSFK